MAQTFKAGDLVKLKSGGPAMTVEKYLASFNGKESQEVLCNWFAGAKAESRTFHQDSLVAYDPTADKK